MRTHKRPVSRNRSRGSANGKAGPKVIDLTGRRFHHLDVLQRDLRLERKYQRENTHRGMIFWKCVCRCGRLKSVEGKALKLGRTLGCSCLRGADLTGWQVGWLTVQGKVPVIGRCRRSSWICRCVCGNTVQVPSAMLLRNLKVSCGCGDLPRPAVIFPA